MFEVHVTFQAQGNMLLPVDNILQAARDTQPGLMIKMLRFDLGTPAFETHCMTKAVFENKQQALEHMLMMNALDVQYTKVVRIKIERETESFDRCSTQDGIYFETHISAMIKDLSVLKKIYYTRLLISKNIDKDSDQGYYPYILTYRSEKHMTTMQEHMAAVCLDVVKELNDLAAIDRRIYITRFISETVVLDTNPLLDALWKATPMFSEPVVLFN